MATPWTAHPHCPAHLRGEVEARVRAFPSSFLEEPANGEIFDNVELCRERLQGFAFSQGFAIVQTSGTMKMTRPRFYFRCIHHGAATANWRKLDEHVERDEDGVITSHRTQEATNINARDCPYFIYLSFKQIGKRGSGQFGLVLGVKSNAHSHTMAANPLVYSEHKKSLPGYQPAIELGRSLRSAHISYSAARRVLEQAGFPLDRKSYYNLRHRSLSAEKDDFASLVVALEDAGFVFECRMEEEVDTQSDQVVDTQLQQIWFARPEQIRYAQRFIADWTLFIDGTFNTNSRNLVLLVMAGITNCDKTFVAGLSFARSESKMSFDFIFWSLKQRVFYPPIPLPRVIISDQAAGMIASLPTALPGTILQYCDWHAVENVMKRLADHGYKKERRTELRRLLWKFVKSRTHEDLAETRTELHSQLKKVDIEYLTTYWGPKETRFLRLYTRTYPNLGAHSNQRSESIHPVTTKILNKNLSIEEATRRLGDTVKAKLRELDEAEATTGRKLPRLTDLRAFGWLADTVTYQAIDRLASEWEVTKLACQDGSLQTLLEPCTSCELVVRFGLPCKHHLRQVCLEGSPIPRSLLHPRWWLYGEPIKITNWAPIYQTTTLPMSPPRNSNTANPYLSPTRNEMTVLGLQVLNARNSLTGYARQRYENVAAQAQRGLVEFAQELDQDDLHIRMPDVVQKSSWRRQLKSHDKAKKRLMTGAEIAEKDANKREQEADRQARLRQREAQALTYDLEPFSRHNAPPPPLETITFGPLPPFSTYEALSNAPITALTAPDTLALAFSLKSFKDKEEEEEEEEEEKEEQAVDEALIPPPSTAPAALSISRAGRKRAPTMKALEAETAPKRGTGQVKGTDKGRGARRAK